MKKKLILLVVIASGISINSALFGAAVNIYALHEAAADGQTKKVLHLLKAGAHNINARDRLGETPLIRAINEGHVNTVQALLDAGANVDARNGDYGRTALMYAIAAHGNTLMKASERRRAYIDIMQTLIANHANVNAQDKDGRTASMLIQENEHAAMIRTILEAGAAAAAEVDAFHDAAMKGKTKKILRFLKAGADVNARNRNGRTPLMIAAAQIDIDTVHALLANHADVNAWDRHGETPLMFAAQKGRPATAQALIDAEAKINAQDEDGNTPLMHAIIAHGNTYNMGADTYYMYRTGEGIGYIDRWGNPASLPHDMALVLPSEYYDADEERRKDTERERKRRAYIDTIETLIANHADVNIRNKEGRTALMLVEKNEHAAMIRALLEASAAAAAAPPAYNTLAGSAERPHTPLPSYKAAIKKRK